jgi:hypothetical protein
MNDCYIFGAWLMQSLMVQVEVQVHAWLMHLLTIHVDYRCFVTCCYRLFVAGCYKLFCASLLVQDYISIYHSDSVTVVPSFYFYDREIGRGKDKWL